MCSQLLSRNNYKPSLDPEEIYHVDYRMCTQSQYGGTQKLNKQMNDSAAIAPGFALSDNVLVSCSGVSGRQQNIPLPI